MYSAHDLAIARCILNMAGLKSTDLVWCLAVRKLSKCGWMAHAVYALISIVCLYTATPTLVFFPLNFLGRKFGQRLLSEKPPYDLVDSSSNHVPFFAQVRKLAPTYYFNDIRCKKALRLHNSCFVCRRGW